MTEKLSEDTVKYTALKQEEVTELKDKEDENDKLSEQLKDLEDGIKRTGNETKRIQIAFNTKSEDVMKETGGHQEKVKVLEKIQRELRAEQEKSKLQLDNELERLKIELKNSEDKV